MKVISISNQKGGVGKSTLTINIASALSKMGLRVLVIDMDEQCNTTIFYCGAQDLYTDNIYAVLTEEKTIDECLYEVQPYLYVVPGSTKMKFFDSEDEGILKRALDTPFLHNTVDVVLIDNPPAINNKTFNSFVASTHVMIVTEAEDFSIRGLQQLEDNIRDIKVSSNNSLEIVGIVMNKIDKRRKLNRQYQAYIKTHYNDLVFKNSISNYSEIPRSIYDGKPISDCYPKSKSCVQFDNVSMELAQRLGCEVKYGNARP